MQIQILVTLDADLADDEISPDPSPGEAPTTWVQDEALEAIRVALGSNEHAGYIRNPHGLAMIKLISVESAVTFKSERS